MRVSKADDKVASDLVSRHGSHLAVGIGIGTDRVTRWPCSDRFPIAFPVYLFLSLIIVALEKSMLSEWVGVTAVAVLVLMYALVLIPGLGAWRLLDRWVAGQEGNR